MHCGKVTKAPCILVSSWKFLQNIFHLNLRLLHWYGLRMFAKKIALLLSFKCSLLHRFGFTRFPPRLWIFYFDFLCTTDLLRLCFKHHKFKFDSNPLSKFPCTMNHPSIIHRSNSLNSSIDRLSNTRHIKYQYLQLIKWHFLNWCQFFVRFFHKLSFLFSSFPDNWFLSKIANR